MNVLHSYYHIKAEVDSCWLIFGSEQVQVLLTQVWMSLTIILIVYIDWKNNQ